MEMKKGKMKGGKETNRKMRVRIASSIDGQNRLRCGIILAPTHQNCIVRSTDIEPSKF